MGVNFRRGSRGGSLGDIATLVSAGMAVATYVKDTDKKNNVTQGDLLFPKIGKVAAIIGIVWFAFGIIQEVLAAVSGYTWYPMTVLINAGLIVVCIVVIKIIKPMQKKLEIKAKLHTILSTNDNVPVEQLARELNVDFAEAIQRFNTYNENAGMKYKLEGGIISKMNQQQAQAAAAGTVPVKCPVCGASVEVPKGGTMPCPYCDSPLQG